MKYADPLYFLFLIPTVIFFLLYILGVIGKEPTLKFSSLQLVKSAGAKKMKFGRIFVGLLRLACMVLVIFALGRPQTSSGEDKTTKNVIDTVIALDISGSMATIDFHPDNRLVAAKIEANKFIEARKDDRIGLVVFAGQSVTQCPLTFDHQAVKALLAQVRFGMLEDGTAIGLGLASAVNRLKDSEAKSKVVVLLTDGINNAGEIDPVTASGLAKQFGIRVYTIGVGKEGEAMLPIQDPRFGQRLIRIRTEIDEIMLTRISSETGGKYFRAQNEQGLRQIFKEIDKLERTQINVETVTHFEEKYFLFLWPALFVFLTEMFWMSAIRVKLP